MDVALLRNISKVAAAAHMPFVGSVGAAFFGKQSMEEVAAIQDIGNYFDRAEYIKWKSFRDTDDARYVGLVMPRVLGRLTEMKDPGDELQASHPLREAKVTVEDIEDNPGFFRIKLFIIPHFQVEGMDIGLSLVSQMATRRVVFLTIDHENRIHKIRIDNYS
ncbi:hypothetical protein JCM10599A_53890 [Paraburkholderia kururiensis]